MQGPKTHEQQRRILERKPDVADAQKELNRAGAQSAVHRDARQSEFPVSQTGMSQESDHNKHNDPGQSGHKPPKPMPAQEKQD